MEYAQRALCRVKKKSCYMTDASQEELEHELANNFKSKDIDLVYGLSSAWLGWIQANSDDWNAIAQLGKVKHSMQWVAERSEERRVGKECRSGRWQEAEK